MSTPSSDDPSERADTLYDPPHEHAEDVSTDDDKVSLRVSMPEERADRLRAVAQQIGLTPAMVAKRAIELVCEEVVTIQDDNRSPSILVDQYQARLDLLHSVEEAEESDESPPEDDERTSAGNDRAPTTPSSEEE